MAWLGRAVRRRHAAAGLLAVLIGPVWGAAGALSSVESVGDAIAQPLTAEPGDARRGRAIVTDRQLGMCLLCHGGPFPEERTPGNLATSLAGAGSRWTAGQLRLRIVDSRRLDPHSIMPAYHRTERLNRVPAALAGRPLLQAQQVEDVVAFLLTLRD
ncbi:MAG: sulfur oxidation c-type cytochrome SoxX [Rubrivivax sp.]